MKPKKLGLGSKKTTLPKREKIVMANMYNLVPWPKPQKTRHHNSELPIENMRTTAHTLEHENLQHAP